MNIFTSYFNHRDPERKGEFEYCLQMNCENKHIKRVIVFDESDGLPFEHKKIIRIPHGRPTYHDFFALTFQYPNDINIITNSDIFFDESIKKAENIGLKQCYCITRHELVFGRAVEFKTAHKSRVDPQWSQDVWIFLGHATINDCDTVLAINNSTNNYDEIKFQLGLGGCDNVIAKRILQSGYTLKNPYLDILCIHNHANQGRPNYSHRITGTARPWTGLLPVKPTRL